MLEPKWLRRVFLQCITLWGIVLAALLKTAFPLTFRRTEQRTAGKSDPLAEVSASISYEMHPMSVSSHIYENIFI